VHRLANATAAALAVKLHSNSSAKLLITVTAAGTHFGYKQVLL
jgi:hypothetical protein